MHFVCEEKNTRSFKRPHRVWNVFSSYVCLFFLLLYCTWLGWLRRALAPRRVGESRHPPRTRGSRVSECSARSPSIIIVPASVGSAVLLGTSYRRVSFAVARLTSGKKGNARPPCLLAPPSPSLSFFFSFCSQSTNHHLPPPSWRFSILVVRLAPSYPSVVCATSVR
jgi:hypothetical protein